VSWCDSLPRREPADQQDMPLLPVLIAIVVAWSFLSIVGSERRRRAQELASFQSAEAHAQAAAAKRHARAQTPPQIDATGVSN